MTRYLVISDVHGNLPALKAVLEAVRRWDDVIVLGDLVDYGPNPGEVIDELRSIGAKIVRGNHDHAVAYGVDCRCGSDTHWLSVWFRENVTMKLLGGNDLRFLADLPLKLALNVGSMRATLVHAAPSNPLYDYLYPWLDEESICSMLKSRNLRMRRLEESARCPKGLYLVGHTHYQFVRIVKGALIGNPGSVGQPRDGDPRAPYMILDAESGRIELGRIKYEVESVIRSLEVLRIPEPYLSTLKVMFKEARIPEPTNIMPYG
ncbi:MAG: metallophosphatase family protein [Desulfurococcales archaeon]|nr:metallophosphatase family protein [Desulfurococcales archaeon]